MKIAVDIDDTLNVVERAKYAGAYIARKKLPYTLQDENANTFIKVYDWNADEVLNFAREGGVIAFTDAQAREGARETLEGWKKDGHEIIILTSRPKEWFGNPEKISRDWLEKRRIPYDEIVAEITDKGAYCAEHGIPVLVDDTVENCLGAQKRGVNAVLAVAKHNRMRAGEIYYGGANWAAIDKAVRRIAQIRTYEKLAARACPARNTLSLDGWELCSDSWTAHRGNHIRVTAPSCVPFAEKLPLCEQKYAAEGKPCLFRLTALDSALDAFLNDRSYAPEQKTYCLATGEIPDFDEGRARLFREPNEWLRDYFAVTESPGAVRSYSLINGECVYATVYRNGTPVAVGMGVLDGGAFGLYDVRVHGEYRRQGYGRAVTESLLREGKRLGAEVAYLQAGAGNVAALELYASLGFQKIYEYWYRVKIVL